MISCHHPARVISLTDWPKRYNYVAKRASGRPRVFKGTSNKRLTLSQTSSRLIVRECSIESPKKQNRVTGKSTANHPRQTHRTNSSTTTSSTYDGLTNIPTDGQTATPTNSGHSDQQDNTSTFLNGKKKVFEQSTTWKERKKTKRHARTRA